MEYILRLTGEEVLALDEYLTRRIGFIGHDDEVDETMHKLADVISSAAEDLRIQIESAAQEVLECDESRNPTTD